MMKVRLKREAKILIPEDSIIVTYPGTNCFMIDFRGIDDGLETKAVDSWINSHKGIFEIERIE